MDSFGLRFGLQCGRDLLGPIGAVALNSPNLGAAIAALCRYFPVLQEQSALTLHVGEREATLCYQVRDGRIVARRQDAELSIAVLVQLMRTALGAHWAPSEIAFEHAPPANRRAHDALLGCPIYFNAESNGIRFGRDRLAAPMPGAEAASLHRSETPVRCSMRLVPPEDFVGRVQEEIRTGLRRGAFGQADIAARLGLAEATLYRRLRARELHYTDLLRDLRRELALSLLPMTHVSLTEIALWLGYSELSAFTRAFTQWTGFPPSSIRRQRDESEPGITNELAWGSSDETCMRVA